MISGSLLWSGAAKPVCEVAGTEQRILVWDKAARLERRAEVVGLLVCHDCARIVMCREVSAHELVKRDSVRAGNFNGSILRFRDRNFGEVSSEIVREDGLKQNRREANCLPARRLISNASNEFKELRRAHNRVRNRRSLNQFFLGHFRAQISARRKSVGADDRDCDVVPYAGLRLGSEHVASRSFEEFKYGL